MDEFAGVVVVLFLILACFVVLLVRLTRYWKRYGRMHIERTTLSSVAPNLKSGDIILFVAHAHGFTNSVLTGDFYSHGAVVVETERGLYLSESNLIPARLGPGPEDFFPMGAAKLTPLQARLKYYPGAAFLMSLERPLTPEQEGVLRARASESLPYPGLVLLAGGALGFKTEWRGRHCMQHVAWLIDEMGLTPEARAARGETMLDSGFFKSSRAVSALGGVPLTGGNTYREPIEIVYDLGGHRQNCVAKIQDAPPDG